MLSVPPHGYSQQEESQFRLLLQRELNERLLRGVDLELVNGERLVLGTSGGIEFVVSIKENGYPVLTSRDGTVTVDLEDATSGGVTYSAGDGLSLTGTTFAVDILSLPEA